MKRFALIVTIVFLVPLFAYGQQTATEPEARLTSGDWPTDAGVATLKLTPEQKQQLQPVFDDAARQAADAKEKLATELKPIGEKLTVLRDAAKKDGTLADLANNQEYQALMAKVAKAQEQDKKAADARRSDLTTALMKVLTVEQKRQFLRHSGLASQDPKRMLLSRAIIIIDHWAPGVPFSDEKFDALTTKIAEMIKKHEEYAAAGGETDPQQTMQAWLALDKKMRAVVEEQLTDEQKKQAAETRLENFHKFVEFAAKSVLDGLDRLDPTPAQQQRAAALAAAAKEKMLKLAPENRQAYSEIFGQLRNDVDALFTDAQRAKRGTPAPVKYGP